MKPLFPILVLFSVVLSAAPQKTPVGTIDVRVGSDLTYGGYIQFDSVVLANNWREKHWVAIFCSQGATQTFHDENYYVTPDWIYAVTEGDGDPSSPSECVAQLKVSYKSGSEFIAGQVLDQVVFEVFP